MTGLKEIVLGDSVVVTAVCHKFKELRKKEERRESGVILPLEGGTNTWLSSHKPVQ